MKLQILDAFMNWSRRMHDLIDFYLFLHLEMYIRGNGRDLTINFDNDQGFSFITENLSMTKENDTVSATFLQSCKYKKKAYTICCFLLIIELGFSWRFLSIRVAAFFISFEIGSP